MTTKVKYICDVCGEVFDDKKLCEQHERMHEYERITDADCRIFCSDGRQMTFEDDSDDCYYYEVNTERGRKAIENFFNESSYIPCRIEEGQFVWYDDKWFNLDYFRQQLADFENVFRV